MNKFFIFFIISMLNLEAYSDQALKDTQALMNDRNQLNQVFKEDAKARDADQFALKAVGGDTKDRDKLYQISSQILEQLTKDNQQDPQKMQEQLLKAAQNPEQFYKQLSPEVRKNIQEVAESVEQRRHISNDSKNKKP
ncbi:MAG: hypothetical protein ACK4VO_08615 [Pseudobdellovibrio sp.]